jgi:hypothetical protein
MNNFKIWDSHEMKMWMYSDQEGEKGKQCDSCGEKEMHLVSTLGNVQEWDQT